MISPLKKFLCVWSSCLLGIQAFAAVEYFLVDANGELDVGIVFSPEDQRSKLTWTANSANVYLVEIQNTGSREWSFAPVVVAGLDVALEVSIQTPVQIENIKIHAIEHVSGEVINADFDGDFLTTAQEFAQKTNPLLAIDSDGDEMPDDWEIAMGYDPADPKGDLDKDGITDRFEDPDEDTIPNVYEFQAKIDPLDPLNGFDEKPTKEPEVPKSFELIDGKGFKSATLVWEDACDNEMLFYIYRADFMIYADKIPSRVIRAVPANTTTWTDTGLDPNILYRYKIQSVSFMGE